MELVASKKHSDGLQSSLVALVSQFGLRSSFGGHVVQVCIRQVCGSSGG